MAYSGAPQAKQVREVLGKALATLQLDPSIPPQGVEVASFMAQAVGSLFVAENAPDDAVGRQAVRAALGLLGQSLAQMQQVQPPVPAIESSMAGLAQAMGLLFPLTVAADPAPAAAQPAAPVVAQPEVRPAPQPAAQPEAAPKPTTQPSPTSSLLSGGARSSKSTLVFAEIPAPIVSITTTPIDEPPAQPSSFAAPAAAAKAPQPQQPVFTAAQHAVVSMEHHPVAVQPVAAAPQPAVQPAPQPAAQPAPQVQPAAAFAPAAQPQPGPTPFAPQAQPHAQAQPQPSPAFSVATPAIADAPPPGSPLLTPAALAPSPAPASTSFAAPSASSAGSFAAVPASQPAHAATHPAPQPRPEASAKPYSAPKPVDVSGRAQIEANIGFRTEANFWVGFEDEVARGGVFVPTYEDLEPGTAVVVLVTLPEGASFQSAARVRFIRDPSEVDPTLEPGLGLAFESLAPEHRDLARRFIARRRPLFYDLG